MTLDTLEESLKAYFEKRYERRQLYHTITTRPSPTSICFLSVLFCFLLVGKDGKTYRGQGQGNAKSMIHRGGGVGGDSAGKCGGGIRGAHFTSQLVLEVSFDFCIGFYIQLIEYRT